jgi:hypothetical protein
MAEEFVFGPPPLFRRVFGSLPSVCQRKSPNLGLPDLPLPLIPCIILIPTHLSAHRRHSFSTLLLFLPTALSVHLLDTLIASENPLLPFIAILDPRCVSQPPFPSRWPLPQPWSLPTVPSSALLWETRSLMGPASSRPTTKPTSAPSKRVPAQLFEAILRANVTLLSRFSRLLKAQDSRSSSVSGTDRNTPQREIERLTMTGLTPMPRSISTRPRSPPTFLSTPIKSMR